MIFTAFVYLASYALSLLASILPFSTGFPPEVSTAVSTLSGYLGTLNVLLPIPTMAIVLGLFVSVEVAIFGFKTFKWIISHLPWVGGKG